MNINTDSIVLPVEMSQKGNAYFVTPQVFCTKCGFVQSGKSQFSDCGEYINGIVKPYNRFVFDEYHDQNCPYNSETK